MNDHLNGQGLNGQSLNGQGRWLFATNFFKHPGLLGSLIPSSRHLIERLLRPVDWSRARRIVEYGPGVGTITKRLLAHMAPDAQLLAFELNPEFVSYLRREVKDPRLEVVGMSAADLGQALQERDWEGMDYAISGIPFSTMPPTIRDNVLRQTREHLHPSGEFLVYQFSDRVRPHLERTFDAVERGFVLRNFLPARCYRCTCAS